jgi:hypothetical protein
MTQHPGARAAIASALARASRMACARGVSSPWLDSSMSGDWVVKAMRRRESNSRR